MKNNICETKGNLSFLLIVDSSDRGNYKILGETVFGVFKHLGIPIKIIDISKKIILHDTPCIFIAQEGIGKKINPDLMKRMLDMVRCGTGIVNLDSQIKEYPQEFISLFCEKVSQTKTKILYPSRSQHYIISGESGKEERVIRKPIFSSKILNLKENVHVLLENERKQPALVVIQLGKGRVVQFLFSPVVWTREYFGHAEGLDDIFYKSLIWSAKKPFIMKSMPPFVTMRVDDCKGWQNFKWIEIANKYGYKPNVGLFINELYKNSEKQLKNLYKNNCAEFSPHAYTYNPDTSLIYIKHNGSEYPEGEIKKRIAGVKLLFKKWNIEFARVLNPHFEEVGKNAMNILKKEKMLYRMFTYLPGELFWGKHSDWRPEPYGHYGYAIDFMKGYSDFIVVASNFISLKLINLKKRGIYEYKEIRDVLYDMDFLWKATEGKKYDIKTAVDVGTKQIKRGLENMFFGLLVTHEHRIEKLQNLNIWNEILSQIEKQTSGYKKIYKSYDWICEYARGKINTSIKEADFNGKEIEVILSGKTDVTQYIQVYDQRGGKIDYRLNEVKPFSGIKKVFLK